MNRMIIAPSVLAMDFSNFSSEVSKLNFNVDWIHFDVMDGHFVPNISFGPHILKQFRKSSPLFMDVHIMVSDPVKFSDIFIDNGADCLTFHYEALDKDVRKCTELLKHIKSKYVKAGISINPDTNVEELTPLLKETDLVLVMSVNPGFGGQKFIRSALSKVRFLNEYRKANNLNFLIEVDGGIDDQIANELAKEGCDVLVAGSYVFKGDIKTNIDKLKHAAEIKMD